MKKRRIVYILFIIVLIVLANISLYYYFYFDNIRKSNTYKTELLVNEKSSITYNIETVDHKYYYSKQDEKYNINNVSKIDLFFNYNLNFDKSVTGEYTYYIRGVVMDTQEEKKVLYKSDEFKYKIEGKNVININHLQNIDLKALIDANNDISTMNEADIKYEMVVVYHIYNKEVNKFISNSKTIEIDIPITTGNSIFKSPNNERNYKEYSNETAGNNYTYLIVCLEFLGSVILYLLCIAYLIDRISPSEYMNDYELETIKHKYKKDIIEIDFIPDLTYKEVLFVDSMDDLVKYSREYKVPIDCINIIKHKETIFAVIYDKNAFVYKVSVRKRK
ncbi:MAG: hypothetical protein IKP76_00515 [Bacilli bacterium]|nr:hypothetical protein [Bacilli bacterium]